MVRENFVDRLEALSANQPTIVNRAPQFTGRTFLDNLALRTALDIKDVTGAPRQITPTEGPDQTILNTVRQGGITADVPEPDEGFSISGFVGDAADLALKPVTWPLSKAGNVFMETLDEINRIPYGWFEGMKEHSETINELTNEGERVATPMDHLRTVDNILGGLWSGFTKQERTGFGEVVEENAKRDATLLNYISQPLSSAVGQGINQLPAQYQQPAKQALGFQGEVFLDPYNWFGGAVVTSAGKGKHAAKFLDEIWDKKALEAIEKAAKNAGIDSLINRSILYGPKGKPGQTRVQRAISKSNEKLLQVEGGTAGGRTIGALSQPRRLADNIADHFKKVAVNRYEKLIDRFELGKMSSKQVDAARKRDPWFGKYIDERAAGKSEIDAFDEGIRVLDEDLLPKFKDSVIDDLTGEIYNSPGIRLPGKTVPFHRVGRLYSHVGNTNVADKLRKSVSYTKQFVGRTLLSNQRIRALSQENYELFFRGHRRGLLKGYNLARVEDVSNFALLKGYKLSADETQNIADYLNKGAKLKDISLKPIVSEFADYWKTDYRNQAVRTIARKFSRRERAELHEAILKEARPKDPKMAEAYDYLRYHYRRMWDIEKDMGARTSKNPVKNYAYTHLWGPTKGQINTLKSNNMNADKTRISPDFIDTVKNTRGVRATTDAFENLLLRQIKSNHKLARRYFTRDLLENYGIYSRTMSPEAANKQNLQRLDKSVLPGDVTVEDGSSWYLPKDIEETRKAFGELSKGQDTEAFVELVDRLTRAFKYSVTIPFAGFHIRNGLGDIFMSFHDGVRWRHYQRIMRDAGKVRMGGMPEYNIAGRTFTFGELKSFFDRYVQTGTFQRSDLGIGSPAGATGGTTRRMEDVGDVARNVPHKASEGLRAFSETREDFFRFVHFYKAFRDEYADKVARYGNTPRALNDAIQSATYRVNKHLFDYGALTSFEQKYLRRAIPFYTYSRKVMPTLLEDMFLQPKYLSRVNRWTNEGSHDKDQLDYLMAPDYLREVGYHTLKDEEEPWVYSLDALPMASVADNLNFSDPQAYLAHWASQSNPVIKAFMEQMTGKSTFNESPVNPNLGGYFAESVAPIKPFDQILDYLKGDHPTDDPLTGNQFTDLLFKNRFLGAGQPFYKISESQQNAVMYEHGEQIKEDLGRVNDWLRPDGLRIYLSERKDGTSYRVRNQETGDVIMESQDPNELIRRLTGG